MCDDSDPALDWTRSHLYMQLVSQVAAKLEAPVTCEARDDGMMHMVSGIPRSFEAFVMMCVRVPILFCVIKLIVIMIRGTSISCHP